mgnify:FL=1
MKRFRMFAGPNGSGKSTLIEEIDKQYNVGFFINADVIQNTFAKQHFIDCANILQLLPTQSDWNNFKQKIQEVDTRVSVEVLSTLKIKEGIMIADTNVDSYTSAIIADFFRNILLHTDASFSFETVMSFPAKVAFLKKVKEQGFKTYLYFICTSDPSINSNRVQVRVEKGGHDVQADKIESRYYKSLALLADAFLAADRAFVIDSSIDEERMILVEKNGDDIEIFSNEIPQWIQMYLLDKI